MDEKPQFVLPERNPKTHAAHRRDVLRQITLPLVIGSLLLVAVMALVIIAAAGANGEVRRWVNGEDVSGGTGCQPAFGYLCLESEGSPVEFRNLRIRELP